MRLLPRVRDGRSQLRLAVCACILGAERSSGTAFHRLHRSTMTGSDFPRPCIIGYGSSPSRCGPAAFGLSRQTRDLPVAGAVLLQVMMFADPGRVRALV